MGKITLSDNESVTSIINRTPKGRVAEIEEIVNPVMFLLSDKSDMINGHHLQVDGGYLAA